MLYVIIIYLIFTFVNPFIKYKLLNIFISSSLLVIKLNFSP